MALSIEKHLEVKITLRKIELSLISFDTKINTLSRLGGDCISSIKSISTTYNRLLQCKHDLNVILIKNNEQPLFFK